MVFFIPNLRSIKGFHPISFLIFEISATYKNVLFGLNAKNKKYDLEKLLKVGSMNEASLNGNWGE